MKRTFRTLKAIRGEPGSASSFDHLACYRQHSVPGMPFWEATLGIPLKGYRLCAAINKLKENKVKMLEPKIKFFWLLFAKLDLPSS